MYTNLKFHLNQLSYIYKRNIVTCVCVSGPFSKIIHSNHHTIPLPGIVPQKLRQRGNQLVFLKITPKRDSTTKTLSDKKLRCKLAKYWYGTVWYWYRTGRINFFDTGIKINCHTRQKQGRNVTLKTDQFQIFDYISSTLLI